MIKSFLPILILSLTFSFSAEGKNNEGCTESMKTLMEEYWNNDVLSTSINLAIKQCNEPAKNGDVESQYDLSLLYLLKNNEKENELSYLWVLKAAENNHSYAQFRLGNIYEKGEVVNEDITEAIKWYEKSAEQNFKLSIRKLVQIYTNGTERISADNKKANYWKQKLK